ncbi:DUF1904 family protein [Bacillus testis]|uniref:DUF1904 family protein n=1 Tax=Bacillus testis TaxID=1622072 RepID=UPI00067EC506|nr:DUF1904 family protein [Bacillus testis]
MPQIRFRGISVEQIKEISKPLVEELAKLCECGTDNFTLECVHSTYIFDGQTTEMYPFIEVEWFERGRKVRDAFAGILTKHVLGLGMEEVEVAFNIYREEGYYMNGESCAE